MSRESLGRFYDEVLKDDELQQSLRADMDRDTFAARVVEEGSKRGFDFTEDEVNAEIARLAGGELSEEQLQALAGGVMQSGDVKKAY